MTPTIPPENKPIETIPNFGHLYAPTPNPIPINRLMTAHTQTIIYGVTVGITMPKSMHKMKQVIPNVFMMQMVTR